MNLYGVFYGSKWAMTRNKRTAIKAAKANHGYVIVHENAYGPGSVNTWDAPTFRVCGRVLVDFADGKKA